ncbi:hypothetical protein [Methylobacterium sp. GC_Met_2]|uniref:hypothetical protein n=1 Tax=Methylobacterium sp. GC_Met_2 TaxID=2937376 RepID=UPI00226BA4DC
METAKHSPIKALPGPTLVVERQPQKGEHCLVDALLVDRHSNRLARCAQTGRGPGRSVTLFLFLVGKGIDWIVGKLRTATKEAI